MLLKSIFLPSVQDHCWRWAWKRKILL